MFLGEVTARTKAKRKEATRCVQGSSSSWVGWNVKFKGKRGPELNGTGDEGFCVPCSQPRLYSKEK